MKRFIIVQSEKEFYTSHSGLALVGLCVNELCSLLVRLDSAHDAMETRMALAGQRKVSYILKEIRSLVSGLGFLVG